MEPTIETKKTENEGNATIQILIAVGGAGGRVKGAPSAFRRWEFRVAPGGNDDSYTL